jgi:sugar phosphate isomerase/epimerase
MKAGVSTASLYPDLQEDCLFALASRGVKYVEVFLNTHSEFYSPFIDRILEIKREYDITITSVHPYTCGMEPMMLFTPYVRRIDDFLEYQKLYFEYMNRLDAKYFILHGGKLPDRLPETEIFNRFALLQELAESFGVKVLQENVVRCSSRDLSRLVRMKEYLGDKACFVLDVKQAKRSGYDPLEHVHALRDSIKHIHYSDSGKKGDCLLFGEGDYDNDSFFEALNKAGFSGAVLLELYREDTDDFADKLAENSLKLNAYLEKF